MPPYFCGVDRQANKSKGKGKGARKGGMEPSFEVPSHILAPETSREQLLVRRFSLQCLLSGTIFAYYLHLSFNGA